MAETVMQNLDIRDFPTVSSVDDQDHAVLSMFSGISAKMKFGMFRRLTAEGITPVIGEDGQWYIGTDATGVDAEGLTPEFRRGASGIEFKYTKEDESAWRPLLVYSDVKMKWEDFTEEQIDLLKLHYEDLTEEDITELQQPATEMIAKLEETDAAVRQAEALREEAESVRMTNETSREEADSSRASAEDGRALNEQERQSEEAVRKTSEDTRCQNEEQRVASELQREQEFVSIKEDYESLKSSFVTENKIVVLPESEYDDAVDAGAIDETKLYFAYEEE